MPFDTRYFARQYTPRTWRAAGAKPILDRTRIRWLRRWIPGGRLLEIGSGLGHFARQASRSFDVVVSDLEPSVVSGAVAGSPLAGIAASGDAVPLADNTLDAVCCFDVLEHLPDPVPCLRETYRVLRPGGALFLSVPNPESLGARRKGSESFIYRDPTHCSVWPMARWREQLNLTGFREIWSGTDGLWDPPYIRHVPARLQWAFCVGATQFAWLVSPGFPWKLGENFTWIGGKPA